jgi:hypothetical protein
MYIATHLRHSRVDRQAESESALRNRSPQPSNHTSACCDLRDWPRGTNHVHVGAEVTHTLLHTIHIHPHYTGGPEPWKPAQLKVQSRSKYACCSAYLRIVLHMGRLEWVST